MQRTHKRLAALIAIPAMLAFSGCSSTPDPGSGAPGASVPAPTDYLTKLYKEAIESGQTHIVGYVPSPITTEPFLKDFYAQFPEMSVELVSLFGPELDSRLSAEIATGGIKADFTNVGLAQLPAFAERGWLEPFMPETAEGIDESLIGPDNMWVSPTVNLQGPIYNSDRMSKDEVPSTWADLVAPKYKGKVARSPLGSGGFALALAEANKRGLVDEEWLKALAAQKPSVYAGPIQTVQALIGGEVELYTSGPYQVAKSFADDGAPVDFVFLKEGNIANPDPTALFKGSPSPAGAKLFSAWMFTKEAQARILETTGRQGMMPGAPKIEGLKGIHIVLLETSVDHLPVWRETAMRILGG